MTAQPVTDRLPYEEADTTAQMARDASACRSEAHLARALGIARRTAESVPAALLQAPVAVARTALSVTDQAARFAARLLD